MLHGGDLQHLSWLGLQWTLLAQRPALREWLKQLFPRLNLETSKLDTNAPESISLLDLEVLSRDLMLLKKKYWLKPDHIFQHWESSGSSVLPIYEPCCNAGLM